MNNLRRKIATGGVAAIVVIVILTICYGLSWIVTCGIIKLIAMCFGLTFRWSGSPEIVSYISDEAEKEMMKLIVSYAKDHPNSYIVDMYLADPKRYEEDRERFKKDYPYIPDDDITVESMSSNSIVYIVEDFLKLKESERLYKQYVKKGYRAISLKGHQVTAYPNNWSDEKIKEEAKDQKIFSSLDDFIIA